MNLITVCHALFFKMGPKSNGFHGTPSTVTSIYFMSSFYFRVHRKRMFIWSGIRFGLLTKRFVGKKTEFNSSKSFFFNTFSSPNFVCRMKWIFRLSERCVSFVVCFDSNEVRSYFSSLLGHRSHSTKIHSSLKEWCCACVYPWGRRGDEIMPVAS